MKYLLLIIVMLFILSLAIKAKQTVKVCKVQFPHNSIVFNQKKLSSCLSSIPADQNISYVHIQATATPPGTVKYNLKLSETRAKVVKDFVLNKYPQTTLNIFGGGENPNRGRQATVHLIMNKIEKTPAAKVVKITKRTPRIALKLKKKVIKPSSKNFQLGILPGIQQFEFGQTYYKSLGAELTYDKKFNKSFSMSIGARIASQADDDFLDIYSSYALLGAFYHYKLFKVGLNLPTGLIANNSQNSFDNGVEGRVGLEVDNWAILFGLGKTKHFQYNHLALSFKI